MAVTAFNELEKERGTLKKIAELKYDKLEMQPYLMDADLTLKQKQLLFKWRTKMVKVGWNYGSKVKCPICSEGDDTQDHLFTCKPLSDSMTVDSDSDTYNITDHMRQLETAIKRREAILEEREIEKLKSKRPTTNVC